MRRLPLTRLPCSHLTASSFPVPQVAALPPDCPSPCVVVTLPDGSEERLACDVTPAAVSGRGVFSSDTSAATGSLLNQELDNIWQLGELEPDNKCRWG